MVVRPTLQHVIVDGSNIATEGRDAPSLAQLDEAVQAFIREYEPEIVTVVVDATFPNRVAKSERKVYEDAINAGEVITPPAGAVGRGDAFVLQIADRAGATVLSNDSFQEFHGTYDWLFNEGRLIGGKPVPHVGWVFMERTPVRGPTSRRAVSAAKRAQVAPPAKAPKAAKATKVTRAAKEAKPAKEAKAEKAAAPASGRQPKRAAKEPRPAAVAAERPAPVPSAPPASVLEAPTTYNEALPFIEFVGQHPIGSRVEAVVEHFGSHGAYLRVRDIRAYAPLKNLADPAPRSAKEVLHVGETRDFVVAAIDPPRRGVDLALPESLAAAGLPPAKSKAEPKKAASPRKAAARKKADKKSEPAKQDGVNKQDSKQDNKQDGVKKSSAKKASKKR